MADGEGEGRKGNIIRVNNFFSTKFIVFFFFFFFFLLRFLKQS
jgi:hypothetical protein